MPAMSQRPEYVIGAMGDHLTLETLPSPNTVRWTPWCKAEVVAAVRGGLPAPRARPRLLVGCAAAGSVGDSGAGGGAPSDDGVAMVAAIGRPPRTREEPGRRARTWRG